MAFLLATGIVSISVGVIFLIKMVVGI